MTERQRTILPCPRCGHENDVSNCSDGTVFRCPACNAGIRISVKPKEELNAYAAGTFDPRFGSIPPYIPDPHGYGESDEGEEL